MNQIDNKKLNIVAAIGLAIGGVFGMAGTFVPQAELRQLLWAIDGVALVVAAALLTVKFLKQGNEWLAAGFLVFGIGEGLILASNTADLTDGVAAFAVGISVWAAALLLTSIPKEFANWIRLVGTVAALLFIVTAVRIFWGEPLLATSSPLPGLAYPLLVVTFFGWIWTLLRKRTS